MSSNEGKNLHTGYCRDIKKCVEFYKKLPSLFYSPKEFNKLVYLEELNGQQTAISRFKESSAASHELSERMNLKTRETYQLTPNPTLEGKEEEKQKDSQTETVEEAAHSYACDKYSVACDEFNLCKQDFMAGENWQKAQSDTKNSGLISKDAVIALLKYHSPLIEHYRELLDKIKAL